LKWRASKSQGGGVILINFVHEIDLMHHFFGPTVRVHAEKTLNRRGNGEDKAEEGVVMTLKFESGVVGTFVISDCVVSPHNFEAGTGENPMIARAIRVNGEEVDVYRVLGTKASLSVPDMVRWSYEGERSWEKELKREKVEIDTDERVPFERQLDHFARVVKGDEKESCGGEEGLRAMIVCDAVRRALDSESGTVVVPKIELKE
jgi:predicted dehydrogenase